MSEMVTWQSEDHRSLEAGPQQPGGIAGGPQGLPGHAISGRHDKAMWHVVRQDHWQMSPGQRSRKALVELSVSTGQDLEIEPDAGEQQIW
jgi:hypothetical protein